MISWMQKHKKWLVITIWISTIAFVGAGFVGWGAYQYGSMASAVAKVGDIKIDKKEFQQRYSNIYSYYNNLLGGKLDKEQAKKLKIEDEALRSLIQEALFLNLAKDLGITVLEDEIKEKIINMKEFQNGGVFDKNLYIEVLKRAGLKPKDFENSIKKEILLTKLQKILNPILTPLEFNTIGSSIFMSDKLKYKVITSNDIKVEYNEDELKKYWEKNRKKYMSKPKFKISIVWVEPKNIEISEEEAKEFYKKNRIKFQDKNGKIKSFEEVKDEIYEQLKIKKSKKIALKEYIKFKKGQIKESEQLTISIDNSVIPSNIMKEIEQKKEKSFLKPKLINKKYAIIRLDKKIPSRPMSFTEAKDKVLKDFLREKKLKELEKMAKNMYKNFDGKLTDFISRDDIDKLPPLKEEEAAEFLSKLFESQKDRGYILLKNQKAILYNILDQKLIREDKLDKNRDFISDNSLKVKNSMINENLLKALQRKYEIEIFYKGQ